MAASATDTLKQVQRQRGHVQCVTVLQTLLDRNKDLEVLLSEPGPLKGSHGEPEAACDSCVARSEIQKVLQNLQGHLLHDLLPCPRATVSV